MSGEEIQQLIKQLKALDLEEEKRKVQRKLLVARLEEITSPGGSQRRQSRTFSPGDRVEVLNTVKRPQRATSTWTFAKERLGTVTEYNATTDQVWFRTDNGIETYRVSKNLKKL